LDLNFNQRGKMSQDLTQTNIRLKQANAFLLHERKMCKHCFVFIVSLLMCVLDMDRVSEKDDQFDTICRLQKEVMWSEKLGEDKASVMETEVEALTMRIRILEEATKRDQTQINALQVECETHKRQLGLSLTENKSIQAKLSQHEDLKSKQEILVESLQAEIMSISVQLAASSRNNALLQTRLAAFQGSNANV
jgi:hypothetical protein